MPADGTIAILTYHSLDESGSVLSVSPRLFGEQMQILSELGVQVVPLSEVRQLVGGIVPTKPTVAITFDDGFRNFYEYGFPILRGFGFSATVFLVTDHCCKNNSWSSQPSSVERRPLLRWPVIKEMSTAGISFGSHTRMHPDLEVISMRDVEKELVISKKTIEDAIGSSVDALAYPYGTYNERVKNLAQAHYALACSTTLDFARSDSDIYGLERLDMYYLRHPFLFRRLFSPWGGAYIALRRSLRSLRGIAVRNAHQEI